MAYTELHTAAIRLVHVTRPTDRDLDYLQREFHLASDDVEAVLGVAQQSDIVNQSDYRRLTIQWPLPARRGIVLTDIHCLVGRSWLVVVDHGDFPAATELINELRSLPTERLWQDGPMMVLYELWRRAVRMLAARPEAMTAAQQTSLTQARLTVGETLKEFSNTAPNADHDPSMIQGFRWLAFTFSRPNIIAPRQPIATASRLPWTARGYATASAAVVIITLLVVSQTL